MHVYDTGLEIILLSCLKSFELPISQVFAPEMNLLLNVAVKKTVPKWHNAYIARAHTETF